MHGKSQAVRFPAEFRFKSKEIFVRRDPRTGDVVLSEVSGEWDEIYAALDNAHFPDNLLADRDQELPQKRKAI